MGNGSSPRSVGRPWLPRCNLYRVPHKESLIAIHTADPELAAIPWEYLHDGRDFLISNYLFVREVPDAPLPTLPDPTLPW